jgi:hydroxyacylglutathione hydrolase
LRIFFASRTYLPYIALSVPDPSITLQGIFHMIRETFPVGLLQCNCTVLGDPASGEAMVIDPGDDIPRILSVLERHKLRVTQIVVTHAHIDHIAGAGLLKRITGAPILYNQADISLAQMMEMQAGWLGVPTPEVQAPDDSLGDGRVLVLGDPSSSGQAGLQATVLLTPGHTQGSLCLHVPAQNLLLAGDTLFAGSVGRTDLPGGDGPMLLRSIHNKLMPLPDSTIVVPGHGSESTIGDERADNPFLQDLQ